MTYAILGAGIVALTFLPWVRARPLRRLLTESLSQDAAARGLIAIEWGEDSRLGEMVVVIANRHGIQLLRRDIPSRFLGWSDIVDIQDIYSTPGQPDMVVIAVSHGSGGVKFIPMRESGMYKLQVPLIAGLVAQLRALRKQ